MPDIALGIELPRTNERASLCGEFGLFSLSRRTENELLHGSLSEGFPLFEEGDSQGEQPSQRLVAIDKGKKET